MKYAVIGLSGFCASCGGSGSSGIDSSARVSAAALTMPTRVNVVSPGVSGLVASSRLRASGARSAALAPAPSSDFVLDKPNVFVRDDSLRTVDSINNVLCMLSQTAYDKMLNRGPYRAQVDRNLCKSSLDAASSSGSGTAAPDFAFWTVNATRVDETSPQVVDVWVHETEPNREKFIIAKGVIDESPTDANPNGIFRLDYKGYNVVNGLVTGGVAMHGYLESKRVSPTQVVLSMVEEGVDNDGTRRLTQTALDGSQSAGGALMKQVNTTSGGAVSGDTFKIAYDTTRFRRLTTSSGTDDCYDREHFAETVWKYGLYDGAGTRVTRDSGYPVKLTKGGADFYGWAGYWGLWMPENANPATGDAVARQTAAGSVPGYSLFIADGRLRRHTKVMRSLGDITGIPLSWSDGATGFQYRVTWTGTQQAPNNSFVKSARLDCSSGSCYWVDVAKTAVDLTTLGSFDFFSESLGGNGHVRLRDIANTYVAPDNLSDVVFYRESIVYPDDPSVPTALFCAENCPRSEAELSAGSFRANTLTSYQYAPALVELAYGGTPVVMTSALADGRREASIMPLVATAAELACDWDNTKYCGWKGWESSEYYTWETGLNSWNHLTALTDPQGAYVHFEPPLRIVHQRGGINYYLSYNGYGQLDGIPGICVDSVNAPAPCGPATRFIPQFSIAPGTELSDELAPAVKYYVKPLEVEQRMQTAVAGCEDAVLPLPTTLVLPESWDWVDPGDQAEPEITAAPAVVAGVVQSSVTAVARAQAGSIPFAGFRGRREMPGGTWLV